LGKEEEKKHKVHAVSTIIGIICGTGTFLAAGMMLLVPYIGNIFILYSSYILLFFI